MRRLLLAAVALIPFAAHAQLGLPAGAAMLATTSAGPPAPCTSGYVDGAAGAPSGTAQFPTILSGYTAPAPWCVAGVNYLAGVPSGTTLVDPSTISMAGVTVNAGAHTVTVTGSNITLPGINFGLDNGWTVTVQGANDTIRNSLFTVGTNNVSGGFAQPVLITTTAASNFSLLNNEFNGANITANPQVTQTINISNGGGLTIQYNYFHNSGGDMIDVNAVPSALTTLLRYNLFKDIGVNTAHADSFQYFDTNVASSLFEFNTVFQSVNTPGGNGLLMNGPSEGSTSNIRNATTRNNTLISLAACNTCNWGPGYYQDTGGTGANIAIYANYIDPTGINEFTGSPWQSPNKTGSGAFTGNITSPSSYYGLTNMVTGALIPVPTKTAPTPQGYYVSPDAAGVSPSLSAIYAFVPSPATGNLTTGQTVTITVTFNAPQTVTGTPTLTLNDGGAASYVSGSGTNVLVHSHTVAAGNSASTLAVTAASGTLQDAVHNPTLLSPLTNITTSFAGLSVNGTSPTLVFSSLGNGNVNSTVPISGTYTVTAPASLTNATYGAGCAGTVTLSGYTPAGGSWSATAPTPTTPCTGTLSVTGTGGNTNTAVSPAATFSPSSSCPDDDGSSGATAGAANYPSLLAGYVATINGVNGLGCLVAGVDYRVGIVASPTLKDPTAGGLPSGAAYGSNVVFVSGNNVTLDGWDFSVAGGVQVDVSAGVTGLTITNSKFVMQSPKCLSPIRWENMAGAHVITHNFFDESGTACAGYAGGLSAGIYMVRSTSGASVVFEYNQQERVIGDGFNVTGTTSGTPLSFTHKFNLLHEMGYNNGSHGDGIQYSGGAVGSPIVSHDTFYTDLTLGNPVQPFHTEAQLTGTITNTTDSFNTGIAKGTCHSGSSYPTGCSANEVIACKQDGSPNVNTGYKAYGNYVDWSGAIQPLLNSGCPSPVWGSPHSNYDMVAGTTLTTSP